MTHEIRTPMNAIVGFSLLLRDDDVEESTKKDYFDIIIKNSESLLVLIDDILDLSKIQSDLFAFFFESKSINTILSEMYKIYSIEGLKKDDIVEIVNGPFKGSQARISSIYHAREEITVDLLTSSVTIPIVLHADSVKLVKSSEEEEKEEPEL